MKQIKFLIVNLFLVTTINVISQAQNHFNAVGDFSSAMNINLLEAKRNTINLEAGDEVGVFDGTVCVGSVVLTGSLGEMLDIVTIACPAGADDMATSKKDGFTVGNPILFKIWDASEQTEINVVSSTFINSKTGAVILPSPTFVKDGSAFVSVKCTFTSFDLQVTTEKSKCYNDSGKIYLEVYSGGTAFSGGLYDVWLDEVKEGRMSVFSKTVAAGVHNLVIGDANGSKKFLFPEVLQPDPISFKIEQTVANCSFDSGRVWIDVNSINGGTAPYKSWIISDDPDFEGWTETMANITDKSEFLSPGEYYVRLFDSKGCYGDYVNPDGNGQVVIGSLSLEYVTGFPTCFGQSTEVNIKLNYDNTNHQIFYSADNGSTWQASGNFKNLVAGETYTFGYKDETVGCTYFVEKKIFAPDPVVVNNIFSYPVSCYGQKDGKIVLPEITGGNGPAWNIHVWGIDYNGKTIDNYYNGLTNSTAALVGLPASTGDYSVVVSDPKGCQSPEYKIAITQPTQIGFEIQVYNSIGDSCAEGRIMVQNISGGVTFSNSLYEIAVNGISKGKLSNYDSGKILFPGNYEITVSDSTGCKTTKVTTVGKDVTPVSMVCPNDTIIEKCLTQTQINSVFEDWIGRTSATLKGGCKAKIKVNTTGAPDLCGGTASVTWIASDANGSTKTCTAFFIVPAVENISVTVLQDTTVLSCNYIEQKDLQLAFENWVTSVSARIGNSLAGGCGPFISNNAALKQIEGLCTAQDIPVTWTINDICGLDSVSAIFHIIAPEPVDYYVTKDTTVYACDFSKTDDLQSVFENWVSLGQSRIENWVSSVRNKNDSSLSESCSPVLTNNSAKINFTSLYNDFDASVTWTLTDFCDTVYYSAVFHIAAPDSLTYTIPQDTIVLGCYFSDSWFAQFKFENWVDDVHQRIVNSFNGGCYPLLTNNLWAISFPGVCKDTVVVINWKLTDNCISKNFETKYSIIAPEPVSIEIPKDTTVFSCNYTSKSELQTVFENWISSMTERIKNSFAIGCNMWVSVSNAAVLDTVPDICINWSEPVIWSVTSPCDTLSLTSWFNLTAPGGECPQHFHTVWEGTSGQSQMNINIIEAKLDGLDLAVGDEIGVFDGKKCVGYGKVAQTISNENILRIVVSADDGTDNGFLQGNDVSYKIWDCSQNTEYFVNRVSCFTNQLLPSACSPFVTGATAFVTLEAIIVPVHFEPCWTGNGVDHMNINIIAATWDELPLEFGDEVAIFDGENCVGVGKVLTTIDNKHLLEIRISHKNYYCGYTEGNKIIFKIWDASEGLEFKTVSAFYFDNRSNPVSPPTFEPGATAFVKLSGVSEVCLTLEIEAGWSLFSIPVHQKVTDFKSFFQPLIENNSLVKIQDDTGNSMENWGIFGGWTNNIGDVQLSEGYKISMSELDTLRVCGTFAELPYPLPLTAGWNIIGFPSLTPVDAMNVVQQLIDNETLLKVQDEDGNSLENWGIFGGWTNNIGNFVAGNGYKIKLTTPDTLWINENYPKSSFIRQNMTATNHFQHGYEGNGVDHMNINLVGLTLNMLKAGDELAIFDGTICVGAVTLMPHHLKNQSVSIAASASDNQRMPGFEEGNQFTLKLWKSINNQEFVLEPEIVKGTSTFIKHETTVASLEKYITTGLDGIPDADLNKIKCYPNPFNDEITIEINLVTDALIQVEVLNQLGQKVKTITSRQLFPGGLHKLEWNGRNANNQTVAYGIYHLRIGIEDSVIHRKIVYSK